MQILADSLLLAPADLQDLLLQLLALADVKGDAARPNGPPRLALAFKEGAAAHQQPAHGAVRQRDAVLYVFGAQPSWIAGLPGHVAKQGTVVRVHVNGHLVRIELELVVQPQPEEGLVLGRAVGLAGHQIQLVDAEASRLSRKAQPFLGLAPCFFGALLLGDIDDDAQEPLTLAVGSRQTPGARQHPALALFGMQDAKFQVHVAARLDGPPVGRCDPSAVLGVHQGQKLREATHRGRILDAYDVAPLFSHEADSTRQITPPDADAPDALRKSQLRFPFTERDLGLLTLGDVSAGPDPFDHLARRVAHRHAARQHIAVARVCREDAVLDFVQALGRYRPPPNLVRPGPVFGVNPAEPIPGLGFRFAVPSDDAALQAQLPFPVWGQPPHGGGGGLDQCTVTRLARPQRFFRLLALDQPGSLLHVEVRQAQVPLGGPVRLPKMRREHAQRSPVATEHWRRLHRPVASRSGSGPERGVGWVGFGILNDYPLPPPQGQAAGSHARRHGPAVVKELRPKAALGDDFQGFSLPVVELNVTKVSALKGNGGL